MTEARILTGSGSFFESVKSLLREVLVDLVRDPEFRRDIADAVAPRIEPPAPDTSDLLTAAAMAKCVGMSESTFRRCVRKNPELRALATEGRRWPRDKVLAWFRRQMRGEKS